MDETEPVSRRGFLRAAAGTTAVAGAAGTASAQETTSGEGGGGGGGGGGPTKTVTVGPGGNLTFDPEELTITPGTTVKWTWDSDGHNIVPGKIPDGASWDGTAGGPSELYDSGHTYTHTFDTKGSYEYWCQPHKQAGMVGSIEVTTDTPGGGDVPEFPDSAKTLGIAVLAAMASTLGLAYFMMKYGGDYRDQE